MLTSKYRGRYSDPNRVDQRTAVAQGRVKSGRGKNSYIVAQMWENHHEIARRLLLGQKNTEVAEAMGCSAQIVSDVRNSPVVKDKLALMGAARDAGTVDLAREIADLAPIALQRIREALETGLVLDKEVSAAGILKEANGLLDRDQGRAVQRIDTRNLHGHFTMEDIERIKEKAKELAGASGDLGVPAASGGHRSGPRSGQSGEQAFGSEGQVGGSTAEVLG